MPAIIVRSTTNESLRKGEDVFFDRDGHSSTAYWYQTEPHQKFEPLPSLDKRMPNLYWKIEPLPEELPD